MPLLRYLPKCSNALCVGVHPLAGTLRAHCINRPRCEFTSLSPPARGRIRFLPLHPPLEAGNPLQLLSICHPRRIRPSATSGLLALNVATNAFRSASTRDKPPPASRVFMLPESSKDRITLGAGARPVVPAGA